MNLVFNLRFGLVFGFFFSIILAVRQFSVPITADSNLDKVIRVFGPERREIKLKDLKTLDPYISTGEIEILKKGDSKFVLGWLTDVIIDFYLDGVCGSRSSRVLCFPSPTVQLLGSKILDESILDMYEILTDGKYQKIFLPCNPTINHWILLVAFKFSANIYVLDPLNDDPLDIPPIRLYVENLKKVLFDLTGKRYKYTLPRRVMLSDGRSCGVFVCYYAYRLIYGGKLTHKFDEMDLRRKIYNSLLDH